MYTLSRIEKKNSRTNGFFVFVISLLISLTFISLAAKFTLNFKQLYYFDVDFLKIPQASGYEKNEILKNYDALITYLRTSYKGELSLPTLPMSEEGRIHFEDVKDIFVTLDYIIIIGGLVSIFGIIYCIKRKNPSFLKWSAVGLLALPVLLAVPFAVNFDTTFDIFHMIFFSNDYWVFDPVTDPIINILPQEFFMHAALLIMAIITTISIILLILHKKLSTEKKRSYYW